MSKVLEFETYRERMNKRILDAKSKIFNRIYNVDAQTYHAGALDAKTKELIGLSSSLVLRCDDCVKYHILESLKNGATLEEITETFEISLVIGGSIVIPHLRRAFEFLDEAIALIPHK